MDLDEIYQEVILDHYRRPRNNYVLENHNVEMEGKNPICGDEIKITAKVEDDKIVDLSFTGNGCAISQASASLMTDKIKGKSLKEFKEMMSDFSKVLKKEIDDLDTAKFGNIKALMGVAKFPARVKCALLAWHALNEGLSNTNNNSKIVEI